MPTMISVGALSARAFGFGHGSTGPAFGALTSLGTNTNATGATLALTGCTVPGGALVVVCVMEAATVAGSVADNAPNTYSLASSVVVNAADIVQAFYSSNVNFLSGGTITYTKHTSGSACVISAFYITGELTSGSPLDLVTTPTTGTSAAISITSGTAAVANELNVAVIGCIVAGETLTQDVTHAWQNFPVIESANSLTVAGGVFVNPGTAGLTYAPTLGTSTKWGALLITFKP